MLGWWHRRKEARRRVEEDATALIDMHGDEAYEIARTRAREDRLSQVLDGNRPPGHWGRVRAEIGRRTNRRHIDTAMRYLTDER